MTDTPDLSTLPQRMRYAADVMDEAKTRLNAEIGQTEVSFGSEWHSHALRKRAQIWDDRDREAAEHKHIVEELARELRDSSAKAPVRQTEEYRELAHHLIESGWRKEQP